MTPPTHGQNGRIDRTGTAVRRIREMILRGELLPGAALQEADLANKLNVSRTPVREAIGLLATEGLVEARPNRSAVIYQPTPEDLVDLCDVRLLLEPYAIYLALSTNAPLPMDDLNEIYEQISRSSALSDYIEHNYRLHMTMYAACGRRHLIEVIGRLRMMSDPYIAMRFTVNAEQAQSEHRQILDALASRDLLRTQNLIRQHLTSTVTMLQPDLR